MKGSKLINSLIENQIPFALGVAHTTVRFVKDHQQKEYFVMFHKKHKNQLEGIKYNTVGIHKLTLALYKKYQFHEIQQYELLDYIEYYNLKLVLDNEDGRIYEFPGLGLKKKHE